MNKENINYSPISVIDCEQLIIKDRIERTHFSEIENYGFKQFLIKSNPCSDDDKSKLYCLTGMKTMSIGCSKYEFFHGKINNSFGIIPTIPYKYVSKIAKLNDNGLYELGHYPQDRFDFISFSLSLAAGVSRPVTYEESQKFGRKEWELYNKICDSIDPVDFNDKKYMKLIEGQKFSYPVIKDNKVVVENCDVYKIKALDGKEIKVILRGGEWYKIEPVEWIKLGDNLICSKILFNSPVLIENDYRKNNNIQSFNDTFLKWYIDNIFIQDLFKYTDFTFMKEQMLFEVDDAIDSKLKEIESLKQIKANLILHQQSQEQGFQLEKIPEINIRHRL